MHLPGILYHNLQLHLIQIFLRNDIVDKGHTLGLYL